MQNRNFSSVARLSDSALATNSVIRNTFILLGLSFLFSSAMAGVSMATRAPSFGFLFTLVGFMFFSWLVGTLRNSAWGILAVFGLTGFMGFTLGPLLNQILESFSNGSQIIFTALGGTGIIFFGLSGYALTTRKDFSYLGGFLMVGLMAIFVAMIAGMFFHMPAFNLAISALAVMLMSGFVLLDLSRIINGGETNYIMATVSIFASLFNIFINLLNLLSALSGRD